jgi:hypothetical protein
MEMQSFSKHLAELLLAILKTLLIFISNFADYRSSNYVVTFMFIHLSHSEHWMKIVLIAKLSIY